MNDVDSVAGDVLSLSIIVSTLADWLPSIAAIISIVWGLVRIYFLMYT